MSVQGESAAVENDSGLNAEEQAQFAEMQTATSGGAPAVDDAAAQGDQGQDGAQGDAAGAQGQGGASAGADATQNAQRGQQGSQEGAQGAGDEEGGQDWKNLWPYNQQAAKPRRISLTKAERIWNEREEALKDAAKLRSELDQTKLGGAKVEERLRILNEAILARGGGQPQQGAAQPGQGQPQQPGAQGAQQGQQGQGEDDPEPDPDKDIFEHNKWMRRQLAKTQQFVADFAQGYQDERDGAAASTNLLNTYRQDIASFAAKEPNFNAARAHLMESRVIELAMFYFGKDVTEQGATLSQDEINQINGTIIDEERGIVQHAMKTKMSPAARVFQLAKARGWRPQAAAGGDGQQQGGQQNAAGAVPAAGAQGGAGGKPTASAKPPGALDQQQGAGAQGGSGQNGGQQVNVADEISRIRNGQAASVSLSDGGGSPQVPLSLERLAKMSDAEFSKYADTFSDEDWRQLGG